MGNGYNHRLHNQNLPLHHKSIYLPMLCSRPSIQEVMAPGRRFVSSNDPLSPRIDCMGQVKRNNKIVGFPTSNKLAIADKNKPTIKYSKLRKMFSANNLTGTSTPSTTKSAAATSCRRREAVLNGARRPNVVDESKIASVGIRIEEMDPPLPVIKKVHKAADGEEQNSLWKRRSGGATLKNLQVQQIQLNRCNLPPTTV